MADLIVPENLASILIDEDIAERTFERRSAVLRVLVEDASITAVAISLLQGPGTIMQVARAIKRWAYEHRRAARGAGRLIFESSRGKVDIVVGPDTDIMSIAEFLQTVMLPKDDTQPPADDIDGLTI